MREEDQSNIRDGRADTEDKQPLKWAFTFGCGQTYEGRYVIIPGTHDEARDEMFRRYGPKWSFQYLYDENFLEIAERWGWEALK